MTRRTAPTSTSNAVVAASPGPAVRLAAAAVLVLASAACSGTSTSDASAPAPSRVVQAQVDPASGEVVLPFDEYWPTAEDMTNLGYALNIKVAQCLAAEGVTYRPVKPADTPAFRSWQKYGVWRMEDARAFGYSEPLAPGAGELPELTGAAAEQEAACRQAPDTENLHLRHWYSPEVLEQYSFMRLRPATESVAGQAVLKEWHACLQRAGIPVPPLPREGEIAQWVSPDLSGASSETLFKNAVADVRCKDEVHLVQRLADIEANAQQAVVERHGTEMEAFRNSWLPLREAAREVISTYRA